MTGVKPVPIPMGYNAKEVPGGKEWTCDLLHQNLVRHLISAEYGVQH